MPWRAAAPGVCRLALGSEEVGLTLFPGAVVPPTMAYEVTVEREPSASVVVRRVFWLTVMAAGGVYVMTTVRPMLSMVVKTWFGFGLERTTVPPFDAVVVTRAGAEVTTLPPGATATVESTEAEVTTEPSAAVLVTMVAGATVELVTA